MYVYACLCVGGGGVGVGVCVGVFVGGCVRNPRDFPTVTDCYAVY